MTWLRIVLVVTSLLVSGCASTSVGSHESSRTDAQEVMASSAKVVTEMRAQSEWMDVALESADAVLIFPRYVRIGYFGSLAGAKGVLMVRDEAGFWNGPIFHSMGQIGGGLQAGVEFGSMVYVVNDPTLVPDLGDSRWQFDASASVVAITTDRGHQVNQMTDSLQAVLFTDMDGLFAGVSLDGAYVDIWETGMNQFHGAGVEVADVLERGEGNRDGVEVLIEALLNSAE